jgi:hypothetical protein
VVQTSDGDAKLLATGCPIDQAEPYGDSLTYGPGHYETWAQWRRDRTVDAALRAIVCLHEYEGVKQPRAALQAFETSLKNVPDRYRSFARDAKAAEALGDHGNANRYYGYLVELGPRCGHRTARSRRCTQICGRRR